MLLCFKVGDNGVVVSCKGPMQGPKPSPNQAYPPASEVSREVANLPVFAQKQPFLDK